MTDTALTNRLRQQSRRAGLMVGITMALTIGICIAGFAGIYTVLAPFAGDFVDQNASARPSATAAATEVANATKPPSATQPPAAAAAAVEPTGAPPTQPPQPTAAIVPRETSTAFRATHTSNARFSINLRSQPNTTSQVVTVLQPSTRVQFLGERTGNEATDWLRFRTEQGQEGWIRQIDVDAITPGA